VQSVLELVRCSVMRGGERLEEAQVREVLNLPD
jgi:hypothetical protein